MVLLTENEIEKFAAPIGRVVLYFAELESVLSDLQKITAEALLLKDEKRDVGKLQWKFGLKIDQIIAWLDKLEDHDLHAKLAGRKQRMLKTADDRHHVIHGQWWLHYMDKTVNTAKPHPKTGELEYREWTPKLLNSLVQDILDHEAFIYGMSRTIKEKWLGEETPWVNDNDDDNYEDGQNYHY